MVRTARAAIILATAATLVCVADPASAHHIMGGVTPHTVVQGLLSGLGHPVIGLDHFAFIIGIGFLAYLAGRPALPPLAFVACTVAGTALHLRGTDIPFVEVAIAGTVLAAAIAVIAQARIHAGLLAALFAVAGLFHGYAYGESIVGAEPAPLYAYLLGYSAIQYGIALASAWLLARLAARDARRQGAVLRVGGAAMALTGVSAMLIALQAV